MINYGYSPMDLSLDVAFCLGVGGFGFFVYHAVTVGFALQVLGFTAICAFIYVAAILMFNHAVTIGLSGPTCAICQQQSIVVALFQIIFEHKLPRVNEVVGISLCILGGLIICLEFQNYIVKVKKIIIRPRKSKKPKVEMISVGVQVPEVSEEQTDKDVHSSSH